MSILFSSEAPHIGKAKVSSALMGVFAEYRAVMVAAQKKEALLLREPADKVRNRSILYHFAHTNTLPYCVAVSRHMMT
jgi:hypothetical protein